ncbi:MAG: trimeric intracellular cation channel family protein [Pseudomonadota bacterium]
MQDLITALDYLGLTVFAISGALAAAEKQQDILGFILFGIITGVGGGTLRDLLLGADIFWIISPVYIWICISAACATWFLARRFATLQRPLLWVDAMGLSLFAVLGTQKALAFGVPAVVAIGMGMMTASFGSLIRDTLLKRTVVLLEPDIYVTAALLGALSFAVLPQLAISEEISLWIALLAAFSLRAAAIIFSLRLPKYRA